MLFGCLDIGNLCETGVTAFARYGAAVFARASERPAFACYGAAVFARAKTGWVDGWMNGWMGGPPSHAMARQPSQDEDW